jgi:transposase
MTRCDGLGRKSKFRPTSPAAISYETTNPQHTALDTINASTLAMTRRYYDPYGNIIATSPATSTWPDNNASFHMVLSYSRDPFCCYTDSMDLAVFFDCHRRAFAHFDGVPGAIVYDRAKTVVRRHVAPGKAVPLHPEAAAFADHYSFAIYVLAAYRPTGKGRVERQVEIVRSHVLAGRSFGSLAEMDAAFAAWLPIRRAQVHRTHGQVIGQRAEADRGKAHANAPGPGAGLGHKDVNTVVGPRPWPRRRGHFEAPEPTAVLAAEVHNDHCPRWTVGACGLAQPTETAAARCRARRGAYYRRRA